MKKIWLRTLATSIFAVLSFQAVALITSMSPAEAQIRVSGDVGAVPRSPIVEVSSLSASDAYVPADTAVKSAMGLRQFGLSLSDIDPAAGAVRALVNVPGDPLKHNIRAWIVTADVVIHHAAFKHAVVYHTLSIVINALTGRYEFAYPATPTPIT